MHFAGAVEFHANEKNHKNNLRFTDWKSQKGFVEPFILIKPTNKSDKYVYSCLICGSVMPGSRDHYVRSHIAGKKHSSMLSMFCLNIHPLQDQQFYCATCDYVIISPCQILSHINDQAHASSQLECDRSRLSLHTAWKSFVCPFVTKDTDQGFYCMACGVSLSSRSDLTVHLESRNHTSALVRYGAYLTPRENNYFHCGLCNLVLRHAVNVRAHLTDHSHLSNSKLRPVDWSAKPDYVAPFVLQAGENNFHCIGCDRPISSVVALESHKNTSDHLEILEWEMDHIAPLENGGFTCKLCQCIIWCDDRVNKHLTGNNHLEKSGVSVALRTRIKNLPKIATWSSIKNAVEPFVLMEGNDKFYCVLCNRYFVGRKALESHTLSRLHKDLLSEQSRFTHLFDNGSMYCSLCDQHISDYCRVDSHLRSTKHSSLWSTLSTKRVNKKYEKSEAASGGKGTEDSVQNQEIESKSNSAASITSSWLDIPEAKKNRSVNSKNSGTQTAQNFENFDESVLDFQRRSHEKSSHFQNYSQVDGAADSIDFRSIIASSGNTQRQQDMENTGANTCSRNLESSGKPNSLADATERKTRLLSENTSPIDHPNGSDNLELHKIVDEQQRDRKKSGPESEVTDPEQKKNLCGSVDSGIENLCPLTPTSSISLENPVGRKRVHKSYLERVATLLDFQEDIYDTSERMMQVELGLGVLFFTDSTRGYCLACRKIIPFNQEINNCLMHLCNVEHLHRLDEMEKRHKEMSAIGGSCDELSLALESIEIVSNDIAKCFVCHMKMENNDSALLQHIDDEKHRKSRQEMLAKTQTERTLITSQIHCDWYQVLKYECAACSIKFDLEIDFVEHLLDDEEHASQLKILDYRGANMMYESCALCALIVCSNVHTNHHETLLHKWFLRNGPFIPHELPESTKELLISLGNNETHERIDVMPEIEKNCRISIVRAYGKGSGHDYRSTFGIEPPVHDIQFIEFFNKICPSTLDMVSFLKQWLVECDLFGAEKMSTVALYWYVVLYLQAISILPSIATLNSMKKFWRGLGESECISEMEAKPKFVLRHHVIGFFRLYANFDYRYDIACPLLGIAIEKRAFTNNLYCLREEMKSYVSYTRNNEFAEPFRVDSVMCLQDPFDLQNNLTKSVSKFHLSRFRTFCSKSLSFLCPSET